MSGSRKVEWMRNPAMRCKAEKCEQPPQLGGLCEEHHKQEQAQSRREMEARELLFRGVVDNEPLQSSALREELSRLQGWWQRTSRELRSPGSDPALRDEAQFAIEWCISLAAVIVEEERAARGGNRTASLQGERTREWVWERFRNLEQGLMSNGLERP